MTVPEPSPYSGLRTCRTTRTVTEVVERVYDEKGRVVKETRTTSTEEMPLNTYTWTSPTYDTTKPIIWSDVNANPVTITTFTSNLQ